MGLTPEQISGRTFEVVRKGYDPEQVDTFLARVAADLRLLLARLPEEGTDPFQRMGNEVAALLRSAQDTARSVVSDAENEASDTRSLALTEANEIRSEADTDRTAARQTVDEARRETAAIASQAEEQARARVRGVLTEAEARLRDLESAELDAHRRVEEIHARLGETLQRLTGGQPELAGDTEQQVMGMLPSPSSPSTAEGQPVSASADELTKAIIEGIGQAVRHHRGEGPTA
ncbi:MAG: DivIVA domain-containing protein [Actinomycetia bacterium]|nr:DivIVA domain-containing protein [Actinomycetes bacterium]